MTKLTYQSIKEVPNNAFIAEEKEFEFHNAKFKIAICNVVPKMEGLLIVVSDEKRTVRVLSNGYIGKAQIKKIHSLYDAAEGEAPDILASLYGIGLPQGFWEVANDIFWSEENVHKLIVSIGDVRKGSLPTFDHSTISPFVEKIINGLEYSAEFAEARNSIVRIVSSVTRKQPHFQTIEEVKAAIFSTIDLFLAVCVGRFEGNEEMIAYTNKAMESFDHDFVIPTAVDRMFEDTHGEKFKGFKETGKGYSRTLPPLRDENGVSMDKHKKPGLKSEVELSTDEELALGVLEKLYGTDVAIAMIKGRELIYIGAAEGNYTDKGDHLVTEILVTIEIAK